MYCFEKRGRKRKIYTKLLSGVVTVFILGILLLSGPVQAITLGIDNFSSETPDEDSNVSFLAKIDLHTNDRIPLTNITISITYSNGTAVPGANLTFDLLAEILSSHTSSLSVEGGDFTSSYSSSTSGYGYGYGYDFSDGTTDYQNQSFDYGYSYAYGYGYNSFSNDINSSSATTSAEFVYNITWETPDVSADTVYNISMAVIAYDGSNSMIEWKIKSPSTITVQNVAEDDDDDDSSTTSGGGSSKSTYHISEDQFKEGETKNLRAGDKMSFNLNGNAHSVTLKKIEGETVTLEIASTPQTVVLNLGESKKFDLTGDQYYDLFVKFDSLYYSRATITIKSIYEKISEIAEPGATITGDVTGDDLGDGEIDKKDGLDWYWWVLIVLVILFVITRRYLKKKR